MWLFCMVFVATTIFCNTLVVEAESGASLFLRCDTDEDKFLSYGELKSCLGSDSAQNNMISADKLINRLDTNGDKVISIQEFQLIVKNAGSAINVDGSWEKGYSEGDATVTVKKRNGETVNMTKSALVENMQSRTEGMQMKNDKIYKEDAKTMNLTELAEENPQVGSIIRVAQWAHRQLLESKHITEGEILNLKTLPAGGSVIEYDKLETDSENFGVKFGNNFTIWLLLTVGTPKAPAFTQQNFEVCIHYNKQVYFKPYLGLLGAWELDSSDPRKTTRIKELENLPPPRYRISIVWRKIVWLFEEPRRNYVIAGIVTVLAALFAAILYEGDATA